MDFRPPVLEIQGILKQIESAQLTHLTTAFQDYFIKQGKYKIIDTWLASERYYRTKSVVFSHFQHPGTQHYIVD